MKHLGQLRMLLLKNILLRRRTLCLTVLECLVPFFYTLVFFLVRYYTENNMDFLPEHTENVTIQPPFMLNKTTVVGYAPICQATNMLMDKIERLLFSKPWFNPASPVKFLGFKSEYSMMKFGTRSPHFLYFAYAFDNMTNETVSLPENLSVVLRVPNDKSLQGHTDVFLYEATMLQILMEVVIKHWSKRQVNLTVAFAELMVAMAARHDSFLLKDMYRVALIIVGLTAFLVWRNVYLIASERESSILILIQQMGVNPIIYWLSWLITTVICNVVVCLSFAVPLFLPVFYREPVLKASDTSLVVIYFLTLGFALSSYCILGSVMFKRAETCSAVASILYVLVTFPAIETQARLAETYIVAMLFTSVNLIVTFGHIGQMEHHGVGYRWQMKASLMDSEHFTLSLVISGTAYLMLAWLVYNIKNHHRPPWAAFKNVRTCFREFSYKPIQRDGKTYSKISIRVEKLCVNVARKLTDITMIMLEDSITVLTGKELSGKGTFMSVLKGEIKPSSGTVKIYGLDIVNDSMAINLITGVCPREQTAVFPDLTVLENLKFFATIKHLCQEKPLTNAVMLAQEFELESILHERVGNLCPSDKRLLQVALAFVGENKVVLLEDPSLSMDIRTKFSLWSIIRDKAYDKTIVLNTNFMDEVEMSGDRIAVFLNGELKCCGTMHYINLYLGAGYHLIIEKDVNCREGRIEYIVYNLIVGSGLLEDSELTMVFWLPMKTTESFHSLFFLLSKYKNKLGILSFMVNATTLHDAIINLNEQSTSKKEFIKPAHPDRDLVPSPSDASVCNLRVREMLNEMLRNEPDPVPTDKNKKASVPLSKSRLLSSILGSFSTDSFLIHAILKSMAKSKCSGRRLLWSQTVALMKKKLLYSTSLLHVEMFQVSLLILLSYWITGPLGEQYCNMNECGQSADFNTTLRTAVIVSQGVVPNNVSAILMKKYIHQFNYSHVDVIDLNEPATHLPFTKFATVINKRPVMGVEFHVSEDENNLNATAYYATTDVDLGPTVLRSLSAVMNTFLQYLTDSDRYTIHPSTQPRFINTVMVTHVSGNRAEMLANRFSHHASVLNAVALLMISYYPVLERLTGSKDLQILSGTKPFLYWFTSFIFDYFSYLFLINTYSMSSTKIGSDEASSQMYNLMLLYTVNGIMMIVFVYVMQAFFSSPSTAVGFLMIFNYCLGNPSSTFLNFAADSQGSVALKETLMALFFLAPPHILPQSVYHLILYSRAKNFCKDYEQFCKRPRHVNYRAECCPDVCRVNDNCLDDISAGSSLILRQVSFQLWAMTAHIFFWGTMLVLVEFKVFVSCKEKLVEHHYINKQRSRHGFYGDVTAVSMAYSKRRHSVSYASVRHKSSIIPQPLPTDSSVTDFGKNMGCRTIVFQGVTKILQEDVIVTDINLKIEEGDIFCLAGSDIEAPSSLVDMICGLQQPTSGKIFVHGKNITYGRRPSVQPIGYSSSKASGLMPMLTGSETLLLFARLRGVAECNLKRLVEIYLNAFNLDTVATKYVANYSDCETQRLSIASALIGEPTICLLCDPMYKLDSESKEAVWGWLRKMKNMKKTVVIATDQLEEIGKHAAYIMILVDGNPVSVGTAKAIEAMCCKGYTLFAKLDPKNAISAISLFYTMLREKFPSCQLFHGNQDLLHFHIPYEDERLGEIFATLERIKKVVKVESYRVNKTNLDQVQIATQNAYFVQGISPGMRGEGGDNNPD